MDRWTERFNSNGEISSMGQYIICLNSGTQLYKRTIMLNGISSSAVCWITCTLMRRS